MEEETKTTDQENESEVKSTSSTKKYILIGVIIIAVGALAWYFMKGSDESTVVPENATSDTVATDSISTTGPVAIVNGEEISQEAYQNSIQELITITSRQGFNTTDPAVASQVRQQALAALVNTRLLVQNAEKSDVVISDQEIADEYKTVEEEAGGAEILAEILEDLGISDTELRSDIAEQLMVDKYLQEETDFQSIALDDGEVATYYETISANNTSLPPLTDIEEELTQQLLVQKQQQHVSIFIQELRDDADIEMLI